MIRFDRELHLVILLTLFLAGIAALGEGGWLHYIRVPLAVICLLFFPGYTVICALFPGKDDLGRMERLALSFAFSVVMVSLIGFLLNFSPWGVRLLPCLISISIFTIAMSLLAIYRRYKLPPDEQYILFLNWNCILCRSCLFWIKSCFPWWCCLFLLQQHLAFILLDCSTG